MPDIARDCWQITSGLCIWALSLPAAIIPHCFATQAPQFERQTFDRAGCRRRRRRSRFNNPDVRRCHQGSPKLRPIKFNYRCKTETERRSRSDQYGSLGERTWYQKLSVFTFDFWVTSLFPESVENWNWEFLYIRKPVYGQQSTKKIFF